MLTDPRSPSNLTVSTSLPYMSICATVILKLFHSLSLPTMHLRNGAVEGLERMSAE